MQQCDVVITGEGENSNSAAIHMQVIPIPHAVSTSLAADEERRVADDGVEQQAFVGFGRVSAKLGKSRRANFQSGGERFSLSLGVRTVVKTNWSDAFRRPFGREVLRARFPATMWLANFRCSFGAISTAVV